MGDIEDFIAALGEGGNPSGVASTGSKAEVDMALKRERTELLKVRRAILQARFHDAAICSRRMLSCIHEVKNGLAGISQVLPVELKSSPPETWGTLIQARFDALCRAFADGANLATAPAKSVPPGGDSR